MVWRTWGGRKNKLGYPVCQYVCNMQWFRTHFNICLLQKYDGFSFSVILLFLCFFFFCSFCMSLRLWYWFQPWVPTNPCFNFCNFDVWLLREIQLKIFSISDFLRTLKKSMLKFCRLSRNLTQIHITTSLLVTCECWKDLFQDISFSMLHFSAHLYFSPKSFLVIRNSANVFHLVTSFGDTLPALLQRMGSHWIPRNGWSSSTIRVSPQQKPPDDPGTQTCIIRSHLSSA